MKRLLVVPTLVVALAGCRSAPVVKQQTAATLRSSDDPFAACVAPTAVAIERDGESVVVTGLGADSPSAVREFKAKADACGAWTMGEGLPAWTQAVVLYDACGADCPAGWEGKVAQAVRKAPAAPPAPDACGTADALDWRGWARERLIGDPDLADDVWLERVAALGRAGLVSAEGLVSQRLDTLEPAAALVLARAAEGKLKSPNQGFQFRLASAYAAGGDSARAIALFKRLADDGTTVWRDFARTELTRLQP